MWQRIQTVYLFLSTVASSMMIFKPFVSITGSKGEGILKAGGVQMISGERVLNTFPLIGLVVVISVISLVSIFLFKKRVLQMRLTMYNLIIIIALIGLTVYYCLKGIEKIDGHISLLFYSAMPFITLVMSFLAWRGIRKDDMILKTIDRIR